LTPLPIQASADVLDALATLGRCEDVTFAPDGFRLALADFGSDRIVVIDLHHPVTTAAPVEVSGFTSVHCAWLQKPHGVALLADDLAVVANRVLDVVALRLPPRQVGVHRFDVDIAMRIGIGKVVRALTPGSVVVSQVAPDLVEVLVCNNYLDCVTRHMVDLRTMTSLGGEVLIDAVVNHPDGVAVSTDRSLVAVSNRVPAGVLLYANRPDLHSRSVPVGTLHGAVAAHGICFTPDDEFVLLADGARPFVYVYRRGEHGWSGDHHPIATLQVMSDEAFARSHHARDDGGPKGVAIDPSQQVVAISAEAQPLAFFPLSVFIGERPATPSSVPPADEIARSALLRELRRTEQLGLYARELESLVAAQDERIRVLEEWAEGLVRRTTHAANLRPESAS